MASLPVNQSTRIHILQLVGALVALLIIFAHPALSGGAHEFVELTGVGLVLVCIVGRMWSILYIGARKNAELVTAGPYSMTRNPLYVFSTIGAVGIGLMTGSVVIALALGLVAFGILHVTAQKEAAYLRTLFGPSYDRYAAVTPLFWPNPRLYAEPQKADFSPVALRRTFVDGLVFLLAFPLIELVEYLQESGVVPVLLNLP